MTWCRYELGIEGLRPDEIFSIASGSGSMRCCMVLGALAYNEAANVRSPSPGGRRLRIWSAYGSDRRD